MSTLLRRLVRLWGQSRIRLPRRPAAPEAIGPGDRLQIGSAVWRVQGRLRLAAGAWMFRLEAMTEVPGDREARLVISPPRPLSRERERGGEQQEGAWTLVVDGAERLLPPASVLVFPAPRGATLTNRGGSA